VVLCVGIPMLTMLFPTNPLYFWTRWVYLLVYPLLFFAVHGLDKLWRFWSSYKCKVRRLVPKVLAIAYVFLLLALSGFYLAVGPKTQVSFFSTDNSYLVYIPSSMLQNGLPVEDTASFVLCLEWLNNNGVENSVVVEHYALYDLSCIYVKNRQVVCASEGATGAFDQNETGIVDGMVWAARKALGNGSDAVYTVWWVSGEGWYKISALPQEFKEVYKSGIMAVYLFDLSV
jgi:hypothetical protein